MSKEKNTVELKDEELEKVSGGVNDKLRFCLMNHEKKEISCRVTTDSIDDSNSKESPMSEAIPLENYRIEYGKYR